MNTAKTATKVEPARHWINGEWVGSATIEKSINPSTGEMLGQYAAGGRVEAAAAIAAARKAFDTGVWPHNPQLRCRALLEFADRLDERTEEIALMLSREMGKALRDSTWEANVSPSTLRYNAGTALSQTGTSAEIAPGVFASATREPIGVAGIIVPWNSPIALLMRALAPALAAGCTTVVKLPGQTALTKDEIFGPVLSFETFATEDEAIARANATIYGLAAAVFTKDVDRAQRVARAIKAGTVWTNTWGVLSDAFEEGGFRQSGIGRSRGLRAMEEFQEVKTQIRVIAGAPADRPRT
jgi:acyl-CoA reductase-like NAD-dependent aldehyde dehydrogenase